MSTIIHKKEIRCDRCGEKDNISIGSYISDRWSDPPGTALECHCDVCENYFYPGEEGGD